MEKPPDEKKRRRFRDLDEDPSKIIITDADPIPTPLTNPPLAEPPSLPVTSTVETNKDKEGESIFEREYESGKRSYAKILKHAFVFLLVIALGILFHHLLGWAGDPKLFDYVPWRYVLDGGDATVAVRLIGVIWKEIGKDD